MRLIGLLLTALLLGNSLLTAYAYRPEPEFLQIKGYSPETVDVTVVQSYRQEWRYPPPPKRTPTEQFWRNVFINDPLGNIDPFGSYKIREKM